MGQPAENRAPQASTVSSCSALECTHNAEGDCHAGSIQVEMREGTAKCVTYEPEPKARP